jgi:hypothetical protein
LGIEELNGSLFALGGWREIKLTAEAGKPNIRSEGN